MYKYIQFSDYPRGWGGACFIFFSWVVLSVEDQRTHASPNAAHAHRTDPAEPNRYIYIHTQECGPLSCNVDSLHKRGGGIRRQHKSTEGMYARRGTLRPQRHRVGRFGVIYFKGGDAVKSGRRRRRPGSPPLPRWGSAARFPPNVHDAGFLSSMCFIFVFFWRNGVRGEAGQKSRNKTVRGRGGGRRLVFLFLSFFIPLLGCFLVVVFLEKWLISQKTNKKRQSGGAEKHKRRSWISVLVFLSLVNFTHLVKILYIYFFYECVLVK